MSSRIDGSERQQLVEIIERKILDLMVDGAFAREDRFVEPAPGDYAKAAIDAALDAGWLLVAPASPDRRFCAPGDRQRPQWLLTFDDNQRGAIPFTTEREARDMFERAETMGWNCHLWELARRKVAP